MTSTSTDPEQGYDTPMLTQIVKSTSFTLTSYFHTKRVICTAALTITLPGTLSEGFECEIINDSAGVVTLDGSGATNVSMAAGDVGTILEANSKQFYVGGARTILS